MNMSYCRFQNTVKDLWDCYRNWEGSEREEFDEETEELVDNLSNDEREARAELLDLCRKIVERANFEDE